MTKHVKSKLPPSPDQPVQITLWHQVCQLQICTVPWVHQDTIASRCWKEHCIWPDQTAYVLVWACAICKLFTTGFVRTHLKKICTDAQKQLVYREATVSKGNEHTCSLIKVILNILQPGQTYSYYTGIHVTFEPYALREGTQSQNDVESTSEQ